MVRCSGGGGGGGPARALQTPAHRPQLQRWLSTQPVWPLAHSDQTVNPEEPRLWVHAAEESNPIFVWDLGHPEPATGRYHYLRLRWGPADQVKRLPTQFTRR